VRAVVFILGGVAAAALGCIDDLRGLRARYKLGVQLAIGLALCAAGFTVAEVQLPGGMVVTLGHFAVPFTVLWIAGVMNAMNLIDGLDGLAGGIAAIALSAVFVFAVLAGNPLLAVFSAALLGAVLGFLFFNFNPATIFMGDAGALLLGYFLAVALLRSSPHPASPKPMELLVPVLVLGVPLCDMIMAICRRMARGRGVFSPDREHLHHRLLAKGFSQRQAVLVLYAIGGLLAAAGVIANIGGAAVDITVAAAVALGITYAVNALKQPVPFGGFRRERQRNQARRIAMAEIIGQLDTATALDHVIETLQHVPPIVSAAAVRTNIGEVAAAYGRPTKEAEGLKMQFSLIEGNRRFGHLEIAWDDGRAHVKADDALAIEEICQSVVRAVRRVSPDLAFDELAMPALAVEPVNRRFAG
jgi:UDP-GlcNAc:undecaprenyl-phosphate GlcNAc-1-phosphate transferase